ncbi:MAG: DUF1127 domain-containing protein [Rhizobiales bacterium]|nr:DUF1127 domain-containing protein [Hyphomicrobiales bacterium]
MSNVHSAHNNSASGSILGGFVRRFRERREMRRILSFDDRLLQDIGLSRGDIQRQSMRSLWND